MSRAMFIKDYSRSLDCLVEAMRPTLPPTAAPERGSRVVARSVGAELSAYELPEAPYESAETSELAAHPEIPPPPADIRYPALRLGFPRPPSLFRRG